MEDTICIIVPTIRPESMAEFRAGWGSLIKKHEAELIIVWDGDEPKVEHNGKFYTQKEIMGKDEDLIYNRSDCVRNLGFYYAYKYIKPDFYITLDDDTLPCGDTIEDHLSALIQRVPITKWINTLQDVYPRGYPYKIRGEAPVMVSHGVWNTVLDLDAPTQLLMGAGVKSDYNKLPIPKGCYIPLCGMAVAFKREALPYMYYAPMGHKVGFDRFADIFLGVTLKDKLDENNWAMVTGYAEVIHKRASNVWANLTKEVKGLQLHEDFAFGIENDDYFKLYNIKRNKWASLFADEK